MIRLSCPPETVAPARIEARPAGARTWRPAFRKGLAALLLLAAPLGPLRGAPVDAAQAKTAVGGWLKTGQAPLETILGQQVQRMETFSDANGSPLYHIAYLEPEGFVIVAADDLVEPIIGFVPGGQFDPSAGNPLGALVSSDLPGRIAKARSARMALALGQPTQTKWSRLISIGQGTAPGDLGIASVSDVRVAPFVKSLWNQTTAGGTACYNYYLPPAAAGTATNYPSGCVATAMAQLMRFWQYPKTGVGTASFSIAVDDVSQSRNLRGGDGAGGVYNWSSMSLTNNSATTPTQRQAIGALCHDAGVAVNMDYTSSGSAADTLQAKTAFRTTFKYTNAIKGYNGGSTLGSGLDNMLNPNLDAACPVLLGITGDGGHAIVCDGYGYNFATLYHHLNLGWGGYDNAWYNLPNIDTTDYTFNSTYKCVYNVWTNGTGEIVSGRVTDNSGTPLAGVALTATRTGGGSYTATSDSRGIYAFAGVPSSSTYTVGAVKSGYAFTSQSVATGLSADNGAVSGNRWAVNFASQDTYDPVAFTAVAAGPFRIDLSWGKNTVQDNVLVAWSTNATFGAPSGTYAAGAPIAGGGTVLCSGGATNLSHTGVSCNATYFYKAWSVRGGPSYSTGVNCSATTEPYLLFSEGFEHAGALPAGWVQEYVISSSDWTCQNGSGGRSLYPGSAHAGAYNAYLYTGNTSDHKTKLVTPVIDLGTSLPNVRLTFWHHMALWSPDQDQLRVFSKTATGGAWTLLATYTNSVSTWTQQTIALTNANSTYVIGFEGNAKYGYGVCVDDVAITADGPAPDSFTAWALSFTPEVATTNAFLQDSNGNGIQNGFEYAFGTNLTAGAPLLSVLSDSGRPVVDIPKQLPGTLPYVSLQLEMTRSLAPAAWSTNGVHAIDAGGEPANRTWFQPDALLTNAFFRLRGFLK